MLEIHLGGAFSEISVASYLEKDKPKKEGILQKQFFPKGSFLPGNLTKAYELVSDPEFSSSYIVMTNGNPLFLLEIHTMVITDVSLYYDALRGDHCLIIFIAGSAKDDRELLLSALLACKEAIFTHPEVKRLIVPAFVTNSPELMGPLLSSAGFSFLGPKKEVNHPDLFICSRSTYSS